MNHKSQLFLIIRMNLLFSSPHYTNRISLYFCSKYVSFVLPESFVLHDDIPQCPSPTMFCFAVNFLGYYAVGCIQTYIVAMLRCCTMSWNMFCVLNKQHALFLKLLFVNIIGSANL